MLQAVAAGTWQAPADGVSLDPYQTVAAVLSCVLRATSLRDGLIQAVRMGGDTDTVAALVGARDAPAQVTAALPWSPAAQLPPASDLPHIGQPLPLLRVSPPGAPP